MLSVALELAAFLKAKRAAVEPQKVGLRPGRRRRANGLLREEVAQRAGISPTWYTWLEQGREINPSTEVLEQLADALLLTKSERAHVLTLARPGATSRASMRFSREVPAELLAWINGLDQPAYVLNGRWDVLAWNEASVRLLGDFGALPAADRNILRMIFLWQQWRQLFVDWECLARIRRRTVSRRDGTPLGRAGAAGSHHCARPREPGIRTALARASRGRAAAQGQTAATSRIGQPSS